MAVQLLVTIYVPLVDASNSLGSVCKIQSKQCLYAHCCGMDIAEDRSPNKASELLVEVLSILIVSFSMTSVI
ncbi:hypothetical protein K461DRAFT_281134 [Myriangium duriaei CBS 260.36]|uniref:Hydrophobin n=1 Tax=Myriangium duriaei CBS 260.36 TaxID=1168546 RepID=A0A9P4ITV9_9PEZI|nr:hypothetical protein K461DRAFT_281134 [Myriangium duriaei CBS 260.36]